MIKVRETRDVQTCYALRHTVFVEEQGYSADDEVDALDADSHHLIATDDGTAVATARVHLADGIAKIGRVCVLKSHRGTGLGADLIRAAVALANQQNATRVVLGAQAHALGFYAKLGFASFGAPYDDEGEPHQMMERLL